MLTVHPLGLPNYEVICASMSVGNDLRGRKQMSLEKIALAIAVGVFACGAVGLALQRMLHEKHTTGPARDMVGAVVGLVTLLSALTLGLLIWTAYGVYSGQNAAIQTLAAKDMLLDSALADYGPDALPARQLLRTSIAKAIEEVWGADISDENFIAHNFEAAQRDLRARRAALAALNPSTDAQKQALAIANSTVDALAQSRLQMSFALSTPVSYPLILTVVAWVALGFLGNGLMSEPGPTSVISLIIGACVVASAFYMILDLSSPYSGIFHISGAPLEQVLAVMGK